MIIKLQKNLQSSAMKRIHRKQAFFDSYRHVYSILSAIFTCWCHVDRFREACEQKFKNFCSIAIIAWYMNSWLRESNTRFPDVFTTINCMNIFRIFLENISIRDNIQRIDEWVFIRVLSSSLMLR